MITINPVYFQLSKQFRIECFSWFNILLILPLAILHILFLDCGLAKVCLLCDDSDQSHKVLRTRLLFQTIPLSLPPCVLTVLCG